MYNQEGSRKDFLDTAKECLILDTWMDWPTLLEMYDDHKEPVDNMCGYDDDNPRRLNRDNPTPYEILNLASDLDSYCGLE
jgi:hypothetical protein